MNIRKDGDKQYIVRGQTPIDEFQRVLPDRALDDESTLSPVSHEAVRPLPRAATLQLAAASEGDALRCRSIDTLRLTAARDIVPLEDRPLVDE